MKRVLLPHFRVLLNPNFYTWIPFLFCYASHTYDILSYFICLNVLCHLPNRETLHQVSILYVVIYFVVGPYSNLLFSLLHLHVFFPCYFRLDYFLLSWFLPFELLFYSVLLLTSVNCFSSHFLLSSFSSSVSSICVSSCLSLSSLPHFIISSVSGYILKGYFLYMPSLPIYITRW